MKWVAAVPLKTGRSWMRIHASVMTPRLPSDPRKRRSGDGPAPDPGRRRDSTVPVGVITRMRSTKSSMWVWTWRSGRRTGGRASRRGSRTRTTEGSGGGYSRAAGAGLRGPGRAHRPRCGRRGHLVDLEHPVEAGQVERHRAGEVVTDVALDAADDRRAAAVGNRPRSTRRRTSRGCRRPRPRWWGTRPRRADGAAGRESPAPRRGTTCPGVGGAVVGRRGASIAASEPGGSTRGA